MSSLGPCGMRLLQKCHEHVDRARQMGTHMARKHYFALALASLLVATVLLLRLADVDVDGQRLVLIPPLEQLPPVVLPPAQIMTMDDCFANFPDMYAAVDRSVAYWQTRKHNISEQDTDVDWAPWSAVRILIHNNELRILSTAKAFHFPSDGERMLSLLTLINNVLADASAAGERLPTIQTSLRLADSAELPDATSDSHSTWTFARNMSNIDDDRTWLIPDHLMESDDKQTFVQAAKDAQAHDSPLSDKIPKAVWTGVTSTNPEIREGLIRATAGKSWAHVSVMDWKRPETLTAKHEFCQYAFTIHTEGRTYSGRLAHLLLCDSVPIVHDLAWTTHFYHLLKHEGPDQNYVRVKRDWSDLEEKVTWLLDNPDEAQRIISNSLATFRNRYISKPATHCYVRRLIYGWASVSHTPRVYRLHKRAGLPQMRGTTWEAFYIRHKEYEEVD